MSDIAMFLIGGVIGLGLYSLIGVIRDRRETKRLARQLAEMSKWRRP